MTENGGPTKRRRTPEQDTAEQGYPQRQQPDVYASQHHYHEDHQDPLSLELAAAASLVSLTTAPPQITRSDRLTGQDHRNHNHNHHHYEEPTSAVSAVFRAIKAKLPLSTASAVTEATTASTTFTSTSTSTSTLTPTPTPTIPSISTSSTSAPMLIPTPSSTSIATLTTSISTSSVTSAQLHQLQDTIDRLKRNDMETQDRIRKFEEKISKLKENEKIMQTRADTTNKRLKEYREKNKEAELQLRSQEKRIGTLQLELQKASPAQPVVKAPVGTVLRIDKFKRKRGKKLTEDERRLVLHCLEMCRLEQDLGPSIATGDPFLRAAVYLGMSTHTVRDTSMDRNLEDKRTKEEREKRSQGQGQGQDHDDQEQGESMDMDANGHGYEKVEGEDMGGCNRADDRDLASRVLDLQGAAAASVSVPARAPMSIPMSTPTPVPIPESELKLEPIPVAQIAEPVQYAPPDRLHFIHHNRS